MNILLLPCHSILEYDEFRLFHELGHNVFSTGSYITPKTPQDSCRPPIESNINETFPELLDSLCKWPCNKNFEYNVNPVLLDWCDTVIIHGYRPFLENNAQNFWRGKKRVIYRTIGQSTDEAWLKTEREANWCRNFQIVRYSPKEKNIPNFAGEDALIRFAKKPEEYGPWNGQLNQVMMCCQHFKERGEFVCFEQLNDIATTFWTRLYGRGNENVEYGGKESTYEELMSAYRNHRVLCHAGTKPASYTLNFIEALMTGIPIVSFGAETCNIKGIDLFEVPEILQNIKQFSTYTPELVSDNIDVLKKSVRSILYDWSFAEKISETNRLIAIDYFNFETIKQQWANFLGV